MASKRGFILILLGNLSMLAFASYEGQLPLESYPPYNPIDMEQFEQHKPQPQPESLSESERGIPMTFHEALKMVRRQKMQNCVALIICTLSCDPHSHGPNGDEAFKQLTHFGHITSNSTRLPENQLKDINMFREAEAKGASHRNHCDLCSTDYPKCRRQVEDLLKIFLNFDIHD